MADILFLRGAPAFSSFRLQALQQRVALAVTGAHLDAVEYWHFVATRQPLTTAERRQLSALLEERAAGEGQGGELFLVTPRVGTISPWSSKASDIASNSGLQAVERIERGIAFWLDHRQGRLSPAERASIAALLHDRMLETVLDSFARTADLFRHF
nr:phosphoribosylformylglycinamidine synthase [Accumulibacter sp.]